MKDSAIKLGKRIFEYLRARCNTQDYLLNQDYRSSNQTGLLALDRTATEEMVISFMNSGLGPSNY